MAVDGMGLLEWARKLEDEEDSEDRAPNGAEAALVFGMGLCLCLGPPADVLSWFALLAGSFLCSSVALAAFHGMRSCFRGSRPTPAKKAR